MRNAYRALALTMAMVAAPTIARAQTMGVPPFHFGAQADFATDGSVFGVGGRVEYGLTSMVPSLTDFRFVGSFDVFFPSAGSYWEINPGVATSFNLANAPVKPYAGAGLNIAHGTGNTDIGLNLFGGVKFKAMGTLTPFAEARLELGGGENFIITGGIMIR